MKLIRDPAVPETLDEPAAEARPPARPRDVPHTGEARFDSALARLALLDDIVEHLPTSVLLKEVRNEFRIVRYNRAAEALYGLSCDEALGRNAYDLWPAEEADRIFAADSELVALRRPQEYPERLLLTRGRGKIRVHMRKAVLFDAQAR